MISKTNSGLSAHVRVYTQEPDTVSNKRVAKHQLFNEKPLDVLTLFHLNNNQGEAVFTSTPIKAPFYGQRNPLFPNLVLAHDFVHKVVLTNPYVPNARLGSLGEMLEGVSSIHRYQQSHKFRREGLPKGLPLHRMFTIAPQKFHLPFVKKLTDLFSKGLDAPLNPELVVQSYQTMQQNVRERPELPLYELQQERKFLDHLHRSKITGSPLDYQLTIPSNIVQDLFTNYENILKSIRHFGHFGEIPTNYFELLQKSNHAEPVK